MLLYSLHTKELLYGHWTLFHWTFFVKSDMLCFQLRIQLKSSRFMSYGTSTADFHRWSSLSILLFSSLLRKLQRMQWIRTSQWHVTSEVHTSRYVRTQSSKKQRGAHVKERKKTLPDAKQIQLFPISLKRWHLRKILLLYKRFQTWSAAVWWKAIYWMRGSVCWSHNGPCCWPQPSVCVCKSHKHKTERKKTPHQITAIGPEAWGGQE